MDTSSSKTPVLADNQPVERAADLHANLLAYARTFERFKPYKTVMGWAPSQVIEARQRLLDNEKYDDDEDNDEIEGLDLFNPFVFYHPVEVGLLDTRYYAVKDNVDKVKKVRAQVVGYLEQGYQRISLASETIREFRARNSDEYLALNDNREKRFIGLQLLEQYKNAFARDVTKEVKERIEEYGHQKLANQSRDDIDMIVDRAMSSLKTPYGQKPCWDEFIRLFNQAISMLDENFSAMRKARLSLFDHNVTSRQCNIDLDFDNHHKKRTGQHVNNLQSPSVTPTELLEAWISQPTPCQDRPEMSISEIKSQLLHLKSLSG